MIAHLAYRGAVPVYAHNEVAVHWMHVQWDCGWCAGGGEGGGAVHQVRCTHSRSDPAGHVYRR